MGFKCYFAIFLLAALSSAQSSSPEKSRIDSQGEFVDQQLLKEREANMREDFRRDLNPWVQEELSMSERNSALQSTQSFLIQLQAGQEHEFRWPIKAQNANFQMKIRVFTHQSGDDITIIKNPDQDSRVDAYFKHWINQQYIPLASVYLQKMFQILVKEQGLFILLHSTHLVKVIVQVSLELEPLKIDVKSVAKNDHMQIAASKLETILAEMRVTQANRKWQFKWQWGFLEREQHYEEEMLKLTVSEAVIILATAIVQMYCIKALLDNHNVI